MVQAHFSHLSKLLGRFFQYHFSSSFSSSLKKSTNIQQFRQLSLGLPVKIFLGLVNRPRLLTASIYFFDSSNFHPFPSLI